MLKFFWNGIKGSDGKLYRAFIHDGELRNFPSGTITISARDGHFSAEVAEQFKVYNETDSQSDYFENDRIRVIPTHPLYPQVLAAQQILAARYEKKYGTAA